MATFAVINNETVENCIVAESLANAESISGKTCVEYFCVQPGWTYSNGIFIEGTPEEIAAAKEIIDAANLAALKAGQTAEAQAAAEATNQNLTN